MTPTHPVMNYCEIDTAADILKAFKGCANAGEEIQLFESLAEREHPPTDAFVAILREIKLEAALALAIQAFGKIKDDRIKADLKDSPDLLAMLCEQAKSGATDLIRWSAATTIEQIGFDFIAVSRHLTEEPEAIIQRIVQSKVRVLTDSDRNRHGITENNDYDGFIRFWVYGATYELRAATVAQGGGNAAVVVNAVVKAQDIWGIKQTNFLFLVLENHARIDLNGTDQRIYENQLFEQEGQLLASQLLIQHQNSTNVEILVSNQIHCLQSNIPLIRKNAALILKSLDPRILDVLQQHNSALSSTIATFSQDISGDLDNFSYQELSELIGDLEMAEQYSIRCAVHDYCQSRISAIKLQLEKIRLQLKKVEQVKKNIQNSLIEVKLINQHLYAELSSVSSESMQRYDSYSYNTSANELNLIVDSVNKYFKSAIDNNKHEFKLKWAALAAATNEHELITNYGMRK